MLTDCHPDGKYGECCFFKTFFIDQQAYITPSSSLLMLFDRRQDANGRIYYVNHIQRTTQWQRPTLSQANNNTANNVIINQRQSEMENFGRRVHISLDSNDEQLTDETDTLATTPKDESASGSDPNAATTSNKTMPARLQQVPSNVDDQASSSSNQTEPPTEPQAAAAAAATAAITNSRPPPDTDLPPNWSMQIAPNGRTFYIDHNKKTTTWNHPVTNKPSPVPPKGSAPNRIHSSSISSNTNSTSNTLTCIIHLFIFSSVEQTKVRNLIRLFQISCSCR